MVRGKVWCVCFQQYASRGECDPQGCEELAASIAEAGETEAW